MRLVLFYDSCCVVTCRHRGAIRCFLWYVCGGEEVQASGVLALFELALQSLEAEVDGFLE